MLYIPPKISGTYREDCPKCRGKATLSVSVEERGAKWFCHRAACGYKGKDGVFTGENRKPTRANVKDRVDGYNAYPVKDNEQEVKGWVHHAIDSSTKPKRIMYLEDGWCGLAFPRRVTSRYIVLVEDVISATRLSINEPCAALLGVYLSDEKIKYLHSVGISDIILALDNDATLTAVKSWKKSAAISSVWGLKKDIKDMDSEEYSHFLQGFRLNQKSSRK